MEWQWASPWGTTGASMRLGCTRKQGQPCQGAVTKLLLELPSGKGSRAVSTGEASRNLPSHVLCWQEHYVLGKTDVVKP